MESLILATNLKRCRVARKLSQQKLSEAAGISLPAYKRMEKGDNVPRFSTVQAVARALNVKPQDLLAPVRVLTQVRFRSSKKLQTRENVLADVSRWLMDFTALEEILGDRVEFRLRQVGTHQRISDRSKRAIQAAQACREELGLKNDEPIYDLCGLLESAGVKVYPIASSAEGFFGLSVGEEEGGPAVIVNVWERIAVERRIFTAAHELGHLILHLSSYDVTQETEDKAQEQEADRFAAHFLMPDEGFLKEWNEASGLHWVERVFKVKRIFRVSYKTVLHRLLALGLVDESIWVKFNMAYQKRFQRSLTFKEEPFAIRAAEPLGLEPVDFAEDRLSRLVRQACEQEKISISRGAEILRVGLEELRNRLKDWEDESA